MENDFDSFKLRLNSEINSSKTMAIAFISSTENYLKSLIKCRQQTIDEFKFKIAEANLKVESQKNSNTYETKKIIGCWFVNLMNVVFFQI